MRIDDPVGAVSVHFINGIWGTLAVGIFGSNAGLYQFGVQALGVISISAFTVATGLLIWGVLKATIGIRVETHEEMKGLDLSEHGQIAYAGFSMTPDEASEAEEFRTLQ